MQTKAEVCQVHKDLSQVILARKSIQQCQFFCLLVSDWCFLFSNLLPYDDKYRRLIALFPTAVPQQRKKKFWSKKNLLLKVLSHRILSRFPDVQNDFQIKVYFRAIALSSRKTLRKWQKKQESSKIMTDREWQTWKRNWLLIWMVKTPPSTSAAHQPFTLLSLNTPFHPFYDVTE